MSYLNAESDALLNGILRIDDNALAPTAETPAPASTPSMAPPVATIKGVLQESPGFAELLAKIF